MKYFCKTMFQLLKKLFQKIPKRMALGAIVVFLIGNLFGIVTQANEIPKEFVRFHIVANSNQEEDQAVKWKVRQAVFQKLDLSGISSKESALEYFNNHIDEIKNIANDVLSENGFAYSASVSVSKKDFPIREYTDFVLPAGRYDSVCITLGKGEGENFFCVMYPSLCMIEGVTQSTDSNVEILNSVLSESQANAITGNKKQIVCKFKIAELLKSIGLY